MNVECSSCLLISLFIGKITHEMAIRRLAIKIMTLKMLYRCLVDACSSEIYVSIDTLALLAKEEELLYSYTA